MNAVGWDLGIPSLIPANNKWGWLKLKILHELRHAKGYESFSINNPKRLQLLQVFANYIIQIPNITHYNLELQHKRDRSKRYCHQSAFY